MSGPRLLSKLGARCSLSLSMLAVKVGWLIEPEPLVLVLLEPVVPLPLVLPLLLLALNSFQGTAMTLSPVPAVLLERTANSTFPDWGLMMTS